MALTRLIGANSISGEIPAVNFNNASTTNVTAVPSSVATGDMVFIKKLTASSSATLSFVDGSNGVVLDDTYKEYMFTFNNMHPSTDGAEFTFNMSTDSGSNYNVTKTTTFFTAMHNEADTDTQFFYSTSGDLAQSTAYQRIIRIIGADNDQSGCAILRLFNPSSSTFVKHFLTTSSSYTSDEYIRNEFCGGYGNTTSSVDAIRFQFTSGNIDAGDICLYGIV